MPLKGSGWALSACAFSVPPLLLQGVVQSAFLWGYMATQLLGGSLADRYGGKRVFAAGIVWFSLASMLLPAALSPSVVGAGLTIPAVLLARCFVVGPALAGSLHCGRAG